MALPKDYNEKEKHPRDVTVESKRERQTDVIPSFTWQNKSIDQWPTQVNLNAVYQPSPNLIMLDGLPTDQQPTWVIPVVRVPRKTSKLKSWGSDSEGYISQIRKLVRETGIYALSSLAAPLVALLLAPFLTHYLSHKDYGALSVLITIITLASGITQLGLNSAFFRAYTYDYESQRDQLDVLSTTILLLLFVSIPTAIVIIVAAPWLSILLLNDSSYSDSVKLSALIILMQNLTVPGLAWLRAESRAMLFSLLSIVNLLIIASATIVLIGVLHLGIAGSLIATGGGYAIVTLCTLPLILLRAGFHLRYDISRGLLIFGLPHVVNLLSGWVLQLSDRYLLTHFGSLSQVASYSVAYSLGGALSAIIIAPFSLAWWTLMFTVAKRDDAMRTFQFIFRWFSIVLLFATFGLSIFGIAVLDLFFPPAYHSTASIIPVIATSIMFNGVYVVVSLGISIQRKIWYCAILITFSGLINFGLNLVLIPLFGAMGAAISTLIAYFALAVITYFVNQRIYPIPFEIGLFSVALLIGATLYLGCDFLAQLQTIYLAWGIRMGVLILYGGSLLLLGRLPARKK
jgi:O-antigen/teichoic acid export membrane protein